MKKTLSMILAILVFAMFGFSSGAVAEQKLKVVTTIFPPYDFIRAVAGDAVELTMLLPPGSESHSFEPTPRDIITIQNCDMFIYTGGEADVWVDRILSSMDTSNMTLLKMLDMVDAVEEVIVEGMEDDYNHGHEEEVVFDPNKVYERALSEWTGSWKSLAPYLEDGSLDEYVQSKADTTEISFSEQMEKQKNSWRTDDFNTFMVAGDKFYIDTGDAIYGGTYKNEGFNIIQRDDGSASVWYQYALADGAAGMPKYIVFNDHGYGTPPEGAETEAGHDHDHGVAHTHLKYGDTNFEDVIAIEGWSTFYVDAVATNEQILDTLLGHGSQDHSHAEEFTLADIKDRVLTDWEGDWQSVYPHLMDGTLDPVMEHKAESGDKTAQEYKEEYIEHYVTDVDRVVINADSVTFYRNNVPVTAQYTYRGTGVLEGSNGLWVRYKFEAVNPPAGAPKYIMFSDHLHAPQKTEHFHIYASDNSFDELMADGNPVNYPTYYSMNLSKDGLVEEMIGHDSGHEHGEMDEHVWTSPENAQRIVTHLTQVLATLDPANADAYRANATVYLAELDALNAAFREVTSQASRKTIVFGDRFPFRYLADAYGLTYYAAFPGCANETEASAATIKFLIDKVREEKIPVVFHIELSNEKIADIVCEDTGAKKLSMHSAHNVTKKDFDAGIGYLEIMQNNLEALKEALR